MVRAATATAICLSAICLSAVVACTSGGAGTAKGQSATGSPTATSAATGAGSAAATPHGGTPSPGWATSQGTDVLVAQGATGGLTLSDPRWARQPHVVIYHDGLVVVREPSYPSKGVVPHFLSVRLSVGEVRRWRARVLSVDWEELRALSYGKDLGGIDATTALLLLDVAGTDVRLAVSGLSVGHLTAYGRRGFPPEALAFEAALQQLARRVRQDQHPTTEPARPLPQV